MCQRSEGTGKVGSLEEGGGGSGGRGGGQGRGRGSPRRGRVSWLLVMQCLTCQGPSRPLSVMLLVGCKYLAASQAAFDSLCQFFVSA